ncbi:MAG: nitroreductase family protein [Candidatus Nealsonbacteria bacterium]
MEIIEAIKKRRSIRRFKSEAVPDDLIKKVIEAGTFAPSACNAQGWRFVVVDDENLKEKIFNAGSSGVVKAAPVGILVVYDKRTKNIEYQDHIQSASAAIQNMLLAAASFGLGSCWIGHLPPKKTLRKILKVPEIFSPVAYIALGYPEKEVLNIPRAHSLEKLIGRNVFNSELSWDKESSAKLFFYRIGRTIYYLLPLFLRRKFLNKIVNSKFEKKFDN